MGKWRPAIMSNTELWEATGEKPILLQIKMPKLAVWRIHRKTSNELKDAGRQKERKTKSNLEKDHFGGNRKVRQNMGRSSEVAEQQDRVQMLIKCPVFLMETNDILLLVIIFICSSQLSVYFITSFLPKPSVLHPCFCLYSQLWTSQQLFVD